jgi:hypothetical protein
MQPSNSGLIITPLALGRFLPLKAARLHVVS